VHVAPVRRRATRQGVVHARSEAAAR